MAAVARAPWQTRRPPPKPPPGGRPLFCQTGAPWQTHRPPPRSRHQVGRPILIHLDAAHPLAPSIAPPPSPLTKVHRATSLAGQDCEGNALSHKCPNHDILVLFRLRRFDLDPLPGKPRSRSLEQNRIMYGQLTL